ncbi:MAG TPA: YdcF family protein [Spirochaetota bacterium]
MLFVLKKIITSFILPPGIFIPLVLCVAVFQFRKKDRLWIVSVLIAVFIYLMSLPAISTSLIGSIEYRAGDQSFFARADCIVLLGGGLTEGVRDLTGVSIPSQEASVRILDAARIYRIYKKPIIVSGGSVLGSGPESFVLARFLADLGVPQSQILIEDRARDTGENARFVREICDQKGYRRVILVTSAYHAQRAEIFFERQGLFVLVYPSGQFAETSSHTFLDYLPSAQAIKLSSMALKEMLGSFAARW